MLASASAGMQVLVLQPQVVKALGLPYPTDRAYPFTGASAVAGAVPTPRFPQPAPHCQVGAVFAAGAFLVRRLMVRVRKQ